MSVRRLFALVAPLLLAAPAFAQSAGAALATPTGELLFPLYEGQRVPGFLSAFDSSAMRIAYPGLDERRALPSGHTLLVLRSQGLLGAYVFAGDRCVGELTIEPRRLADADGYARRLRARGFRSEATILTHDANDFGVDAVRYEHRGRVLDGRLLLTLRVVEHGTVHHVACLGERLHAPASDLAALNALAAEGEQGLVDWCRAFIANPPAGLFFDGA
ncbi:MAG TPA: hypothetical protein V6D47_02810 [Oscillatoriaceae cyanobacterium]